MRKHISIFLVAALMLTAFFGMFSTAQAAGDVDLTVETDVDELAEGGSVEFTAAVTNNSTKILTSYSVMQGSNVKYDSGDAPLAVDDTNSGITFSVDVTEEMLDNPITFTVYYDTATLTAEEGGSDTVTIAKKELLIRLEASCSVSQTIVNAGDIITFTYNLENLGETTLNNIVAKAAQLNSGGAINNEPLTLAPGETATIKYDYTVTVPKTIEPYIEYASDAVDQEDFILTPIELTPEERDVDAKLTVDNKNPQPGEEVTFTLTITNNGTVPYKNLSVTYGGQEMGFSSSTLNPGDIKSEEYTMSFVVSTDVKFLITLVDHENQQVPLGSNTVSILLPVDPQALQASIGLTIAPDVSKLPSAGTITFTGNISNGSDFMLSDVSVTEATLGSIPGLSDVMAPGTKRNISYSADINETTTYNFVLTVKDRNGETYTVEAEPITVTITSAVVQSPGYDDAADVTNTPMTLDGDEGAVGKLGTLAILAIVLVVLILGVGVALIVLWRKGKRLKKASRSRSSGGRPSAKSPMKKKSKSPRSYRDRNNF